MAFCYKCGQKLTPGSMFCGYCGAMIDDAPPTGGVHRKPGGKKLKWWHILLIVMGAAIVIASGVVSAVKELEKNRSNHGSGNSNFGQSTQTNGTTSSNTANGQTQTVNFDLKQYDAHGDLSGGLIWVEKTESSYDQSPKKSFAYLDINGNVKSPWFSSSEFSKADFVNGFVILKESIYYVSGTTTPGGNVRSKARCVVYDVNFNMAAEVWIQTVEKANETRKYELAIIDANERGEIFGFGENGSSEEDDLLMITSKGVTCFNLPKKALLYPTVNNLKKIEMQNGYYVVDIRGDLGGLGNLPCYMGVFDSRGRAIFQPSEQLNYNVYSVKVLSSNNFEIMFRGKDDRYYTARVDATGRFLTEPVAAS